MSRNELGNAISPYLLQHRDNPVHWREWGEAALAAAQAADKPILLSIGYAACHWCHVMAHESFEDATTAALMNDLFVNIKVDREERPDVDHLYMSALHALGEQGGWPLTMFLTPRGEPFWGGTYFPPEAQHGRPAFKTLLAAIAQAYATDKARVAANTRAIGDSLERLLPAPAEGVLTFDLVDGLASRAASHFDTRHGGLLGAPKFPNCGLLEMLWRGADRTGDKALAEAVLTTLRAICQGGIYDHLGGGFARYSVDEKWLVPHFEKMLYDNAQLLEMLALAFEKTGEALFRERARETVAWLAREMTGPDGAFHASLDADSEGEEGKYYIWRQAEVIEVLGEADAALFCRHYDVTAAGNFADPHSGKTGSVLNRLAGVAADGDTERRLADMRGKLFLRRAARVRPGLDDKVLADWNGLMIAALARAAAVFREPDWLTKASAAFAFVEDAMSDAAALRHSWRAGVRGAQGFALDYAAMIGAALALHEATQEGRYLDRAKAWAGALVGEHADGATGMLHTNAAQASGILLRLAPTADEALPNAHGPWLHALARLAVLTGEAEWMQRADKLFSQLAADALGQGLNHCSILNAYDFRRRNAHVAIAEEGREMLDEALRHGLLNRVVEVVSASAKAGAAAPAMAAIANLPLPAAVVCRQQSCSAPARSPDELRILMKALGREIEALV